MAWQSCSPARAFFACSSASRTILSNSARSAASARMSPTTLPSYSLLEVVFVKECMRPRGESGGTLAPPGVDRACSDEK